MKVLLISPKTEETKGGIAVWTRHYVNECQKMGVHCDIVNTATIGKRAAQNTSKRNLVEEFIRTKNIFRNLKKLLRKNNGYDVAHLNSSIGQFGIIRDYYIAKKIAKKKIPIIVHFHCDVPFWVSNKVIKYYLRKLLKLCNKCFVLCENSRKYLKETFGVDSVKVPNFIRKELIVENKQINQEIRKIFFVGRVSLTKGAKEIYALANKFPNIDFELAGEVSQEVAFLEKPKNIHLLGKQSYENVLACLDKSDLFLFPSHTEGFSMALAESMARGVPSVATDVGANLDMLENKGGIVVAVEDLQAMENAIKTLLDIETRRNMSMWCINKVLGNYTTNKVLEGLLEEYNSLR